jgi:hypothetical protein
VSIAAVPASTTPSANILTVRTETWAATAEAAAASRAARNSPRWARHRSGSARSATFARTRRRPAAAVARYTSTSPGESAASCTQVTPAAANSALAAARPSCFSAAVGRGACRSSRSIAVHSTSVPIGVPSGRRATSPAGGSAVRSSMPARRSASVFAQTQWWSVDCSTTGRSGTAASSQAASNRPPGARLGS